MIIQWRFYTTTSNPPMKEDNNYNRNLTDVDQRHIKKDLELKTLVHLQKPPTDAKNT